MRLFTTLLSTVSSFHIMSPLVIRNSLDSFNMYWFLVPIACVYLFLGWFLITRTHPLPSAIGTSILFPLIFILGLIEMSFFLCRNFLYDRLRIAIQILWLYILFSFRSISQWLNPPRQDDTPITPWLDTSSTEVPTNISPTTGTTPPSNVYFSPIRREESPMYGNNPQARSFYFSLTPPV